MKNQILKNSMITLILACSMVFSLFATTDLTLTSSANSAVSKVRQEDVLSDVERQKIESMDPTYVDFLLRLGHGFEKYKSLDHIDISDKETLEDQVQTFYLHKMDFAPERALKDLKFALVDLDKNGKHELLLSLSGESLNFIYTLEKSKLKLVDMFGYRSEAQIYEDVIHVVGAASAFEHVVAFLKLNKGEDELEAIEEITIVDQNGTQKRTLTSKTKNISNKSISSEEFNDIVKRYTQRPQPIWHNYSDYVNLKHNTVKVQNSKAQKGSQKREIKVWIDEYYIYSDAKPILIENSTFVPLRMVSEALDYEVKWNAKTSQITITDDDHKKSLVFTVGSNEVVQNGQKITTKYKTLIKDGRSYVPFRMIAEFFGKSVDYDAQTMSAIIGKGFQSDEYYKVKLYLKEGEKTSDEKVNFRKMELKKGSLYETFATEGELLSHVDILKAAAQ